MELKFYLGIEIVYQNILLIVPYGIEIAGNEREARFINRLLIVPYGIEIK